MPYLRPPPHQGSNEVIWDWKLPIIFYTFWIKNNTSTFHEPWATYIFQNTIIRFLKLKNLQRKQQLKLDLLRLLSPLFIELALWIVLSFKDFFYWKTKIEYISNFHSSFNVLIFTVHMYVWMAYLFWIIKNKARIT